MKLNGNRSGTSATIPKYVDGKKVANARVEVRHNGIVIHPEFQLAHAK